MNNGDETKELKNSGNYSDRTGSAVSMTSENPDNLESNGGSTHLAKNTRTKPIFTSRDSETFNSDTLSTFYITVGGKPAPSLTCAGSLPSGISFFDNRNGTATLTGKTTAHGTTALIFTAKNSEGLAVQNFTLSVRGR